MTNEEKFERLLKAAAKGRKPAEGPPFGLETRVLAEWRVTRGKEDEWVSVFPFFRRAMAGAALVLLVSAAWSFTRSGNDATADEAGVANYELQMELNP